MTGMASPLIGIAGVNSLLFASYGTARRIISPFPNLTLPEIALAGCIAGAANAILASPGTVYVAITALSVTDPDAKWKCSKQADNSFSPSSLLNFFSFQVRMQGQYGEKTDQRLRAVVREMWAQWGFRKGVMRGYWVLPFYRSPFDSTLR